MLIVDITWAGAYWFYMTPHNETLLAVLRIISDESLRNLITCALDEQRSRARATVVKCKDIVYRGEAGKISNEIK